MYQIRIDFKVNIFPKGVDRFVRKLFQLHVSLFNLLEN